jgi:hypothetical protein
MILDFALIALPNLKGLLGIVGALGGLIFVHELGHFLMAKRMGMASPGARPTSACRRCPWAAM